SPTLCGSSTCPSNDTGQAFYRIPKDPERGQRWITAVKRARSEQRKTGNRFCLCSDHFMSEIYSNTLTY
uniref:THAP-type domain-containing protein n=1 Tax=Lates calcarifer TaxID=8187 RepID=A0A4W6D7K3_LATCA